MPDGAVPEHQRRTTKYGQCVKTLIFVLTGGLRNFFKFTPSVTVCRNIVTYHGMQRTQSTPASLLDFLSCRFLWGAIVVTKTSGRPDPADGKSKMRALSIFFDGQELLQPP